MIGNAGHQKSIRGYLPLKRPRNLTRQEKEYIASFRLNPFNWLISKKVNRELADCSPRNWTITYNPCAIKKSLCDKSQRL
ncbi:DUF6906 family protein [Lysinibacillus sp. NPDC059133]|uniref:DUF6906 family protein n=1 Tax=Lysinibacillus sp. NPDC059133 TaxID=3346737 RepID=UPI00369DA6C5